MSFETQIRDLNEHFFFREFTFSKNTFSPVPRKEVELADNIIWLDDLLFVFQLKERKAPSETNSAIEEKWFKKKVLGTATRQIRDTLSFLSDHNHIRLKNHRGEEFQLSASSIAKVHKVVCYLAHKELPEALRKKKFHKSQTAGIIHLMPADDYAGVVQVLLTLAEIAEYFEFREEIISNWGGLVAKLPEQALLGQYLAGDLDAEPKLAFAQYPALIEHRSEEWDMSGVIKEFPDRINTENDATDYYKIIAEIAKLKRNELREFKTRFTLSMDKARANIFAQPYRMAIPRTDCGFVFIPMLKEHLLRRRQGLKNLTVVCKYDLKLPKCVGISFAPENGGWFSVEWCYAAYSWERDSDLDERLLKSNPFRETKTIELGRYTFVGDK